MNDTRSTPLYQRQTPIEIIGPCSDVSLNKSGKLPGKARLVLTFVDTCQNNFAFLRFWLPRLWKKVRT